MKLGTWQSKGQAILRNLRRFWPAMVVASIWLALSIWSVAMDMISLQEWSATLGENLLAYDEVMHWIGVETGANATFYACLCAFLLMGDNFKGRYANAVCSFPQTREERFVGIILSGFVLFLIPLAVSMVLFLSFMAEYYLLIILWLLIMVVFWLAGFAVGMLAATLTGTVFGAILTSLILAFGAPLLELLAAQVVESMLAGITWESGYALNLSPVIMAAAPNWIGAVSSGALSLLMLFLALLLYRKRAAERTGDFLAFPRLKPVMKLLCTCMGGILLGSILKEIFGLNKVVGYPGSTLSWFLPGILIARLVSEMVVEKTARVFRKKQLLSYGLCAVLAVSVVFILYLDPFGIETCVPSREDVVSVEVSRPHLGTEITLTEPESIDAAISLHQAVIPYGKVPRNYAFATSFLGNSISISYTLNNGLYIKRYYDIRLDQGWDNYQSGKENHPLLDEVYQFYNSPQWMLCEFDMEGVPQEQAIPLILEKLKRTDLQWYKGNVDQTIYSKETMKELLVAVMEDLESGKVVMSPKHLGECSNGYYSLNFVVFEGYNENGDRIENANFVYVPLSGCATADIIKSILAG
ncbi:MAG: hypothetical protein E7459_01345 [Ruminococcaceae bacterium]|nr:hypothetical protein [Oscillospiraceae bacterium]